MIWKYVYYGSYYTFSEEENELVFQPVQETYNINLLKSPYILQILLGVLIFLTPNVAIIVSTFLVDSEIAFSLFANMMYAPMIFFITLQWIESTWRKKNAIVLKEKTEQWKQITAQETEKANQWREAHSLEERCRQAFENCHNISTVGMAELIRELIKEQKDGID